MQRLRRSLVSFSTLTMTGEANLECNINEVPSSRMHWRSKIVSNASCVCCVVSCQAASVYILLNFVNAHVVPVSQLIHLHFWGLMVSLIERLIAMTCIE